MLHNGMADRVVNDLSVKALTNKKRSDTGIAEQELRRESKLL
jgi:hypothetical protein